jgi:hypothetical protein
LATDRSAEAMPPEGAPIVTTAEASPRYHALDRVRATAMLLGVVYHAILFRMFVGAGGPGPMGAPDSSRWFSDWLHSFRMPLFFLISGFFGRMMLEKYGTRDYLKRRWQRIAIPLFVGLFTFSPLYIVTRDLVGGPRFGPGGGPPAGAMPGLFGPPPPGAPVPGSFGPPPGGPMPRMFGPPPGGSLRGPFGAQGDRLSDRLFGRYSHYFDLHHLWFLWYLLVFVTVAPWVAKGFGWLLPRPSLEVADRLGLRIARWGLAPVVFGLIAMPALLMTSSPFGWSLGLAPAIFRGFPDFLLHLDPDMALYFVFFLWGWWLHRQRAALPALGQTWLPSLLLGLVAFTFSTALSNAYSRRFDAPGYALIRTGGSALYCLGSACTAWGFLGIFVGYLDRPSRTWRYLADTALWVYLIHQPLVIVGLALFRPLHLAWWAQTAAVSALVAATALLLYEAIVRPTPLVWLFGPASTRRATGSAADPPPAGQGDPSDVRGERAAVSSAR